jgi:hypothetical protein
MKLDLSKHNSRYVELNNFQKIMLWITGIVVAGLILAVIAYFIYE